MRCPQPTVRGNPTSPGEEGSRRAPSTRRGPAGERGARRTAAAAGHGRRGALLAWGCALAALAACRTPEEYREDADREVYALVAARREAVFGAAEGFSIDPDPESLRQRILRGQTLEVGPLSLLECLEIAAENSRTYQRNLEGLYLTALDLTLERWRFSWQTRGLVGAFLDGVGDEATTAGASGDVGLSRLLGTGATVAGDLGLGLARSLSTGDGWKLTSDLGLLVTQPLLRGSGRRIVLEPLTQAERNLVYEVRSFERFRRTFAVDVTARLYRLLQQVDTVRNEEVNYENLVELVTRNEALAEAGRLSDIQVDQARQDALRSANRLLVLRADLELAIDDFKLFLGLPIATSLTLDMDELERLRQEEIVELEVEEDVAIALALDQRLDFMNALDVVEDERRQVVIREDALRADLDVALEVNALSADNNPVRYSKDDLDWGLSIGLDLPLERLVERNNYRAQLITLQRTIRDTELLGDEIRFDLRDALREATATREENVIQESSVELAERRVESAKLNLEAGRADTRDLLEAQEDLLSARNGAIRSRIDYTLARLSLFRDMELLRVTEAGVGIDSELLEAYEEAAPGPDSTEGGPEPSLPPPIPFEGP